jgi:hypothetical protein
MDATERRMGEYLEGVRRMGELLTPELEQLGFTVAPAPAVRLSDHSPRRAAAAIR